MATIIHNARIHTMGRQGTVEAALYDQGRFIAVGGVDEVRGAAPRGTREIDLGGMTVIPGLTDSHVHFVMFSLGLSRVDLDNVPTLGEALARIESAARLKPKGAWVIGGGFNANLWGGVLPSKDDLDRVCPDHPCAFWSKDYHSVWVNSRALHASGIGADTPTPEGGRIDRRPDGTPTGILGENATRLIERAIPKPTGDEIDAAVRQGIEYAHSRGLTGVHVMEGPDAFASFQRLLSRGALTLRVCMNIARDNLEDAVNLGVMSGFGGDMLKIGGVKAFVDGALGSQTAEMMEPYEGTCNRGIEVMTQEEIERFVEEAAKAGLSTCIHAIGDRANRKVLDAFERLSHLWKNKGLRQRIEHAQLLHPADLPRFGRLGVIASVQPIHATSDRYVADRLWGTRARYAYAFKSLLRSGARLAFGSDAPVETIDPMKGVYAAVTRKREDERESAPWYAEETLTVEEAVAGYTTGAAYASYSEDSLGSIEPGKFADFVVLSEDIFSSPPERILSARVMLTVVGGVAVYES